MTALACTSPGNCVAAGEYINGAQTADETFLATETGGTWAGAVPEPGEGALNAGALSARLSVACPAAGDCQLTGIYSDRSSKMQGYVDLSPTARGPARSRYPGLISLNTGGAAIANEIACSSVGRCAVAGGYSLVGGAGESFVDDEVGGIWGTAQEVPGERDAQRGRRLPPQLSRVSQ